MNEKNSEKRKTERKREDDSQREWSSRFRFSYENCCVVGAFHMENDRFTLPRERFSPRFLPFPLLSTGEKEKDVRGRENFHSLSSTPRFVSPFFLSLHASFPRASLGIGRSINPAQIKLSRHRIFNGRCLIYEGERINVSIKLHRV